MPPGRYCDVISGNKQNGGCTGKTVTVDATGKVRVSISNWDSDPVIAIHSEVSFIQFIFVEDKVMVIILFYSILVQAINGSCHYSIH